MSHDRLKSFWNFLTNWRRKAPKNYFEGGMSKPLIINFQMKSSENLNMETLT